MREPGADRWRKGDEGPEASPDDFDARPDDYDGSTEEQHSLPSSKASGSEASASDKRASGEDVPRERPRRKDSGRRRDPYDFSKAGPYSTPPPYVTGGPDYLGREEPPARGEEWYIGRGPKGYRRPPERIREDVCERLTFSPYVDASDIEIEVDENGVVQLSGHVDSRRTKRITEDICDTVFGVSDVKNGLSIGESPRH
jgi:hypothetical protein